MQLNLSNRVSLLYTLLKFKYCCVNGLYELAFNLFEIDSVEVLSLSLLCTPFLVEIQFWILITRLLIFLCLFTCNWKHSKETKQILTAAVLYNVVPRNNLNSDIAFPKKETVVPLFYKSLGWQWTNRFSNTGCFFCLCFSSGVHGILIKSNYLITLLFIMLEQISTNCYSNTKVYQPILFIRIQDVARTYGTFLLLSYIHIYIRCYWYFQMFEFLTSLSFHR